jgi:uncharacterized protein
MDQFDKPSSKEEEYFARQEAERLRQVTEQKRAQEEQESRERLKALHFMKCPKCGMDLQEEKIGEVLVDKCQNCGGLWLDQGELEKVTSKPGLLGRVFGSR